LLRLARLAKLVEDELTIGAAIGLFLERPPAPGAKPHSSSESAEKFPPLIGGQVGLTAPNITVLHKKLFVYYLLN
jgi:hypothetical protein